jgi:hypothetical protein
VGISTKTSRFRGPDKAGEDAWPAEDLDGVGEVERGDTGRTGDVERGNVLSGTASMPALVGATARATRQLADQQDGRQVVVPRENQPRDLCASDPR